MSDLRSSIFNIPIELMELLNKINDNINEVKERITRIEAQDHSDSIKTIKKEHDLLEASLNVLEVKLVEVRTKVAPLVAGVAFLVAGIVEFLGNHYK